MTADPGETPAGTAGAGTADLTLDAEVAAADVPPALIAQSLGQYVRASWLRVRSGNSGVLPVVLAIVVVAVVFEIITPEHAFLRPSNLVYIFALSTVYMVLAMAETVVLLLAEVDLSVGAVALIGGVIAFKLVQQPGPNWPWWLAVLASLAYLRRDRRPPGSADRGAQNPVLRLDPGRVPALLGSPRRHPRRGRHHA